MYSYSYNRETNFLTLFAEGGRVMDIPLNVRFSLGGRDVFFEDPTVEVAKEGIRVKKTAPVPEISEMRLDVSFCDGHITVSFEADAREDIAPYETELFRAGGLGIKMIDCLEWFAPQPRNYDGINRAFNKRFCDLSMNGYFSPPPLNFTVGNKLGLVSFGLLDLPYSYEYRMTVRLGIIVERPCAALPIAKGETYRAPRMIITFPKDEYEGITLYRDKLQELGIIDTGASYPVYDWWRRPIAVTYGDEMMLFQHNWFNDDDLDSPAFSEEWLYDWLERTERRLGNREFTVIVDAFWQYRYTPEAIPDESRFPNFRGFIDYCHSRGHKVLLWTTPFLCNTALPFKSLAEKYGMLTDESFGDFPLVKKIDFTPDSAEDYMRELCERYFGDGDGCLNCDGVKLDFLASLHKPESSGYKNPKNGIGISESYRFHKLFSEAARRVKADVLINSSVCDPRFEGFVSMNRLHDIQKVYSEREIRARVSALGCPNLLIDSDGAIMISDWVKETYISAVVYSTPSLYYIDRFHDSISWSDEEMQSLGALLSLSEKKPKGVPRFISEGNWWLDSDGRVGAACFDGDTVTVFSDCGRAYFFTWREGTVSVPHFGYEAKNLPEGFSLDGDMLTASVTPGKIYEYDVK